MEPVNWTCWEIEPANHLSSTCHLSSTYYLLIGLSDMYQFISIAYIIYLPMYLLSTCPSSIIYQSFIYQLIIYLYLSVCLLMCVYLPSVYLLSIHIPIIFLIYHLSISYLRCVCLSVCLSMHNCFRLTHIWYTETKPCLSDFYGHGHPNTTWPLTFCSPNQNPARSRVPWMTQRKSCVFIALQISFCSLPLFTWLLVLKQGLSM